MSWLFAILLVLAFTTIHEAQAADDVQPVCPSDFGWARHPTNCSRFYYCFNGEPVELMPCADGMVFSLNATTCVAVDSSYNDCGQLQLTVEERCQINSTAIFPHPEKCQLYYNCSNDKEPDMVSYLQKYMEECPYPQLFSEMTSRCEHYNDVTCGDRVEYVDACDYYQYRCLLSHCTPCKYRWPRCNGLPDGRNVFEDREWTPLFVVCRDNRTVETGYCPDNQTLQITEFFSPDRGQCVSLYEIPREYGGYPLNCTQKADGLHPDDVTSRPDLYFRCDGGQLGEIALCPSGTQFNATSQLCV